MEVVYRHIVPVCENAECIDSRWGLVIAKSDEAAFPLSELLPARVLKRHNQSMKVILYENNILAQDQKILIQKMADTLGVSYTAFFNRLKELDLFDCRPIEEYLHAGLHYGGETHASSS